MSIRLPHTCFVHIPRTGGMWLEKVLGIIGIKHQVLRGDIDSHFRLDDMPDNWYFLHSFTFIRHPIDWVRSRWSHALEINAYEDYRHYKVHRVFDECVRPTLRETIETILERERGLVNRTYQYMTRGVKTIIRTEDLMSKLPEFLKAHESITDEQVGMIRATEPINSTSQLNKYGGTISELDDKLIDRFLRSESRAIKLWEDSK